MYFIALLNDLLHVSVVVVKLGFRLVALIGFSFDLNELHAVLLLLGT